MQWKIFYVILFQAKIIKGWVKISEMFIYNKFVKFLKLIDTFSSKGIFWEKRVFM